LPIPKRAQTKKWACAHWCVSPSARNYTTVPVINIRPDLPKNKPPQAMKTAGYGVIPAACTNAQEPRQRAKISYQGLLEGSAQAPRMAGSVVSDHHPQLVLAGWLVQVHMQQHTFAYDLLIGSRIKGLIHFQALASQHLAIR
jgi:hypothetical protein